MSRLDLHEGVRTVTHLADHFARLKSQATELNAKIDPGGRGYFKPAEDEQALQLLVSYWHARNALVDLIHDYRQHTERVVRTEGDGGSDDEYPASFLVAFAAALVLIDAARFLRETATHSVVRAKLNEPAPSFGIPAGVYDHVQRSLLSSRNAWRLYHAIEYFEREGEQLRRRARESGWLDLLEVIDRLRHRLEVTVLTFTKARIRTRGGKVLRGLTREMARRAMYGFQKLSGSLLSEKYVRPTHRPGLPPAIDAELRNVLRPGDVLMTRKEYALTNYFLPGYWPHAALYLGRRAEFEAIDGVEREQIARRRDKLSANDRADPQHVLESMRDGVQLRGVSSPFGSDSVVILRPHLQHDEIMRAFDRAMRHEGKGYDFDFDFGRAERLVCTEVVYRAYDGMGPMQFKLTTRAGRPTLSGGDVIQLGIARQLFTPVAAYAPRLNDSVQWDAAAVELMRSAMGDSPPDGIAD